MWPQWVGLSPGQDPPKLSCLSLCHLPQTTSQHSGWENSSFVIGIQQAKLLVHTTMVDSKNGFQSKVWGESLPVPSRHQGKGVYLIEQKVLKEREKASVFILQRWEAAYRRLGPWVKWILLPWEQPQTGVDATIIPFCNLHGQVASSPALLRPWLSPIDGRRCTVATRTARLDQGQSSFGLQRGGGSCLVLLLFLKAIFPPCSSWRLTISSFN